MIIEDFIASLREHDYHLGDIIENSNVRHAGGYLWIEVDGPKSVKYLKHKLKFLKRKSDGMFYRNRRIFIGFSKDGRE